MYVTEVSFSNTSWFFDFFCFSHCWFESWYLWEEFQKTLSAAADSVFSSVYVIGTDCFDECFSFYVATFLTAADFSLQMKFFL